MTRLPAMMVFSMEPVGISLFAMTKVVSTKAIKVEASDTYDWQEDSTYIRLSPFFDEMGAEPLPVEDMASLEKTLEGLNA